MSASAEIRIVPVPLGLVPEMLPHAGPHLARGVAVADLNMVELASDLMAGTAGLWCIFDCDRLVAAFFTAIHDDDGRTVHVYGLGGTGIWRWADALDAKMQDHGRANGCRAVRFHGRRAWARVLPAYRTIGTDNGAALYERAIA